MAATITVDTLITTCPTTYIDTNDMSEWLTKCYRFADIENYPEIKETSWIAMQKIDSLESRRQYRETVLNQLKAVKLITVQV